MWKTSGLKRVKRRDNNRNYQITLVAFILIFTSSAASSTMPLPVLSCVYPARTFIIVIGWKTQAEEESETTNG